MAVTLDSILNFIIPIAAVLFFFAILYQQPAIKGAVDLVFGWVRALFRRGKEKAEEKIDEGFDYFPKQ